MAMFYIPPSTWNDQNYLGVLACRFRSTRDIAQRTAIAHEYAVTVRRLIESGNWYEGPAPEDQLPDDWMPREFFAYWMNPDGPPDRGTADSP